MTMTGRTKVTTEKLRKKKEAFEAAIELAGKDFQEACEACREITECFDTESVRKLQRKVMECGERGESSLEQIKLQIKKLEDIAAVYEKAEGGNIIAITEN